VKFKKLTGRCLNVAEDDVKVLVQIKKLLGSKKRWCQEAYSADGAYCLVGAVEHCDPEGDLNAKYIMANAMPSRYATVESFNDLPRRTHAQILEFLDHCITQARGLVKTAGKGGQ